MATNLKWLLTQNSVILMPTPRWETWLMEGLLKPWVHYVPIDHPKNAHKLVSWLEALETFLLPFITILRLPPPSQFSPLPSLTFIAGGMAGGAGCARETRNLDLEIKGRGWGRHQPFAYVFGSEFVDPTCNSTKSSSQPSISAASRRCYDVQVVHSSSAESADSWWYYK